MSKATKVLTYVPARAYALGSILTDRASVLQACDVLASVRVHGKRNAPLLADSEIVTRTVDGESVEVEAWYLSEVNPILRPAVEAAAASVVRTYLALSGDETARDGVDIRAVRGENVCVNGATIPMRNLLGAFCGDTACAATLNGIRRAGAKAYRAK